MTFRSKSYFIQIEPMVGFTKLRTSRFSFNDISFYPGSHTDLMQVKIFSFIYFRL